MSSDRGARLIALFFLASVLFSYPIIRLFSGNAMIMGIPLLYFYIVTIWLVIIWLIRFLVRGKGR